MNGRVAFDDEDIRNLREKYGNEPIVLVRPDTVPDDIGMIFECDGLLTARGGATSHAAVTAVRLGKTCVAGCTTLDCNEKEKYCMFNELRIESGDHISIDGQEGSVYQGLIKIQET